MRLRDRPGLLTLLVVLGLAAAVAVSTAVTVLQTDPQPQCPDDRYGCAEFEPDEPIQVGALLPTTGPRAADGASALRAAEAVAQDETAGRLLGHDLVVVGEDDACDPAEASGAARIFGTSESPTKPPYAAVLGGICLGSLQPGAQILTDTGVPFVSWFDGDLTFAEPRPPLRFLVRIDVSNVPGPVQRDVQGAILATSLIVDAIGDVAIRLADGTVLVPRVQLLERTRELARTHAASLASP